VNDPIYDWQLAEKRMLPMGLQKVKMDAPNCRYASNVLGPISYSEAQQVAHSIGRYWDEGYDGRPASKQECIQLWFKHVMEFNNRFKQPESWDTFKHS
jgi:hypothetical protein